MHCLAVAGWIPALILWTASGPAIPWTEAEFLASLSSSHPALAVRAQDVAFAEAGVTAASTLENPSLDVLREDPSGPAEQLEVTFSWQLPGAARKWEVASAEQEAEAARARFDEDALSMRLRMREVYAGWAVAVARGEVLAARERRIAELAAREKARAERGETSPLEARRLALAAAELRAHRALAEASALRARAAARGWVPDLPDAATPVLPQLPEPPSLDGSHPRLDAAAAELRAAELALRAAGRFLRPPAVQAGWQRQDGGPETADGPLLGLTWSLPLFDRNQAGTARAKARVGAAEAKLESVRRELDAASAGAVDAYRRLADASATIAQALADNDTMLLGAAAAFRHGELSLTDLLETLRATAESEMTALDLYAAALAAHRDLERFAGRVLTENTNTGEKR